MEDKKTFKDWVIRTISVIGLIAILLLGAWGIIQLAFAIPDFVGNFMGGSPSSLLTNTSAPKAESVAVSVAPILTSGQSFPISWTHQNKVGNYGYQVVYSCATGLSMKAPLPTGGTQTVPCDTPFNFTNATSKVDLVPMLTGKQQASVTFTVLARGLENGQVTATGSSTVTILPTVSATKPSAPRSTTSSYVPAKRTSSLYGYPDLATTINSSQIVGERVMVVFTVQNVGTNVAPQGWIFNAQLPLVGGYTYTSAPQQALYPGDKIVYTLGFDDQYNQYVNSPSYSYPTNGCTYATSYTYDGTNNYQNVVNNCPTYPSYNYTPVYQMPTYNSAEVSRPFSVTVDPDYLVTDASRTNNTASLSLH